MCGVGVCGVGVVKKQIMINESVPAVRKLVMFLLGWGLGGRYRIGGGMSG